ncbi:hypothetical protein [Halopiger xanaduensis]|nr:hypothetical protein [Halopiger xanaduensis]
MAAAPFAAGFDSGTAQPPTGSATQPSLAETSVHPSLTATTTDNASYYDDFEDRSVDGWTDHEDISASTDSFYGNYSLQVVNGTAETEARWNDGPEFDLGDNFEISGTIRIHPQIERTSVSAARTTQSILFSLTERKMRCF